MSQYFDFQPNYQIIEYVTTADGAVYNTVVAGEKKVIKCSDAAWFNDPDGNGVEVFYEMPRAEWPVDYNVFTREKTGSGRVPGPWDAEIARAACPGAIPTTGWRTRGPR